MRGRTVAGLACGLLLWAAAMPVAIARAQQGDPALSQKHLEAAEQAAGSDLRAWLDLCRPAPPPPQNVPATENNPLAPLIGDKMALEPIKVFDNVYFVGTKWVSAWAIRTSDGIILIDALNNDEEAERFIASGLRKLGLDPAQIKYLVVSHAHGDHYGGARYLAEKYHPRVVMSEVDWRELEKPVLQFDNVLWGRPPKRDMAVADGHKLQLGDTVVELYLTPGHTPGTLTTLFTAKDGSATHRALIWGGTAFNFGKNAPQMRSYVASADRMADVVAQEKVDVILSNHAKYDGSLERMAKLAMRKPGDAHPYVIGHEAVGRAIKVIGECARSFLTSFDAEGK